MDEMFGNKTKVRLLRAFFMYPEKGFTESELERIAEIPQASVHRNVISLIDNGLLDRKRIGKANLFSLNKEHGSPAPQAQNIISIKKAACLSTALE